MVAEGVETPLQLARLREIRCDFGQGYVFGRPRPAELVDRRVRAGLTAGVSRPACGPAAPAPPVPSGRGRGGRSSSWHRVEVEVGALERHVQVAERDALRRRRPAGRWGRWPSNIAATGWRMAITNGAPGRSTRCTWRSRRGRSSTLPSECAAITRSIDALVAKPRSASSPLWHSP